MYDAVVMGELLIDFAYKGSTENGYPILHANPGGAPGNFVSVLAKYGLKTGFIGKVGEDVFGSMLTDVMEQQGVDTRGIIRDPNVFTTLAFVTLDEQGDREFSFARKPGADTQITEEECNKKMLKHTKIFHFGTLSMTNEPAREATRNAVKVAKKAGAVITFDPNLREPLWPSLELAKKQMRWGIRHADIVKISWEELELISKGTMEEAAAELIQQYGVKLVFVTLGKEGCFFMNPVASGKRPTFTDVKTVDTTGAGDIFGGSAIYQVLKSDTKPEKLNLQQLTDIVTFANAAASLSTVRSGGIPSIPAKEEVERFLQQHTDSQ